MELLAPMFEQLTSGLAEMLIGLIGILILSGVRYMHKKTGLVDSEAMLNAETLLNATIEANVREQEQVSIEADKAGQPIPKGADKEADAIQGVLDDLKDAVSHSGATIAKRALQLATTSRLQRRIKGFVGKLF